MTYYFSLLNLSIKDFWSDKTVFGGAVVLMAPDESLMLFKCDFVRKRDDVSCSVFKIELEPNEFNKYVHNMYNRHRIKLANITSNSSNSRSVTWASLHNSDDFDKKVEEPYHYYHFAVNLKEKFKLNNCSHEPIKSIKIADIFKNNGSTVEFSLFDEKMMFRPDGTIYYAYSVKIPDKYIGSFVLEKDSFIKVLYVSDSVTKCDICVAVTMYRSINGPKGLKDSMGLEERRASLKNFWQPEAKPWDFITTKPECNITIDIPKDFTLRPYVKAEPSTMYSFMEDMRKMSMFESDKRIRIPEIKEVIFNEPATVVYWKDGDKTSVKCGKDEPYDREKGVAMCLIKKMLKPSKKSHWLDVIHDAIQAADDKVAKIAADKEEKARIKAENIAKAEEARRKKAEKKAAALKEEIQTLEKKDNTSNKELLETIKKENNKVVFNKNGGVKIDQDLFLECVKENLTIDEIAEMNSWDKAAVARMYYKVTGKRPEKKNNTYSELDELFEKGVSVDAAARRTGFSKNIVAMRYAKLQNKKN